MKKGIYFIAICALLANCSSEKKAKKVTPEPSEKILLEMAGKDFSLVLDDMKIEDEADHIVYKHKYNVLKMVKDSLHEEKLDWKDVNESYFEKHKNDLGMEILSLHNGKISKVARPVGFGWAIGNEAHGNWEIDSTQQQTRRRWSHSSMSPFFWYWLVTRRSTYRNDYRGFQNQNLNNRPYYGSNASAGRYDYGTRSEQQQQARPNFFNRRTSNTSKWSRLSKRSSRYSSGSSVRSRSGGFGK